MGQTKLISGEGADVARRAMPYDTIDHGFSWTEVEVRVGAFHGALRADFRLDQFVLFHFDPHRMQHDLRGRAELAGVEDCRILIEMNRSGRARATGGIGSVGESTVRLSFEFDTDQTCLATSLRQFTAALRDWSIAHSHD
jgi:hypothetical protein